ncbi:2-hydroxyacid dehydrogenase [Salinicola rhizosphaerae]|uniref:Bifunctional glyoxylate/hydroxypyruvate reductase B n=1 Tax=Salinicola rhizosphaerae TaxID=1443141 RepID=A0ABQ3DRN9_9GAMM|nr:D-glycerate dehydrogenase [Salinicola rhizosphaerae]GHB12063.1 bifunctional glyoxylate/hydroxypyruvate reductase B [Salinicola rhizosphaerae]
MKDTLVIVHELYPELLDKLKQTFDVVHFVRLGSDEDRAAFKEAMTRAVAFIGSNVAFDKALLEQSPNLKVIASVSVGVDNYDVAAIHDRGIVLTNTPDVLTEATADTGFLLLMMTARRASEMNRMVLDGRWNVSPGRDQFGVDLKGKTLGIVGMGRIGQAVASRGHFGFGMKVIYQNRSAKPEADKTLGARQVDLETLFTEADFICVTVPLSPETEGLIGRDLLSLTKPKAIFVNIARGKVVREQELIECLRDGTLYYAGLDVFEKEPLPKDSPLMTMDNVVCLPHIGSATHETRGAMCDLAAENTLNVLDGKAPVTPV